MTLATRFASTTDFLKGGVEIVRDERAPRYIFSNLFEVAAKSAPWARVVVARNLEFTIECVRAEGDSPWFLCGHVESALVMQGEVEIHSLRPQDRTLVPATDRPGAVRLAAAPTGTAMGHVRLRQMTPARRGRRQAQGAEEPAPAHHVSMTWTQRLRRVLLRASCPAPCGPACGCSKSLRVIWSRSTF